MSEFDGMGNRDFLGDGPRRTVSRRTVLGAAAWSVPVLAVATATPAFAAQSGIPEHGLGGWLDNVVFNWPNGGRVRNDDRPQYFYAVFGNPPDYKKFSLYSGLNSSAPGGNPWGLWVTDFANLTDATVTGISITHVISKDFGDLDALDPNTGNVVSGQRTSDYWSISHTAINNGQGQYELTYEPTNWGNDFFQIDSDGNGVIQHHSFAFQSPVIYETWEPVSITTTRSVTFSVAADDVTFSRTETLDVS